MAKTTEIIIYDSRRTQQHTPLPGITRVDRLRVLGVTLTRRLSASEHVRQVRLLGSRHLRCLISSVYPPLFLALHHWMMVLTYNSEKKKSFLHNGAAPS